MTREVEQLELAIEILETDQAEQLAADWPEWRRWSRPLSRHRSRRTGRCLIIYYAKRCCTGPRCGGALCWIGKDVTETLDYLPSRFKVIRCLTILDTKDQSTTVFTSAGLE